METSACEGKLIANAKLMRFPPFQSLSLSPFPATPFAGCSRHFRSGQRDTREDPNVFPSRSGSPFVPGELSRNAGGQADRRTGRAGAHEGGEEANEAIKVGRAHFLTSAPLNGLPAFQVETVEKGTPLSSRPRLQ